MTWPVRIPGPEQLAESPELAAIEMLEAAMALTTNALIAQNGELGFDDFIATGAASACLADAIVNHIDGLQNAISRYRDYLQAAEARRSQLQQPDF